MTHDEAMRSRAVERYVLTEMTFDEREAFEEHFFSCGICAEEVRLTSVFVDNAKAILSEPWQQVLPPAQANARPRRNWFSGWFPVWAPGALAVALSLTVVVQTLTIHRLREPRLGPVAVLHGESRGDVPIVGRDQPLTLLIATEESANGSRTVAAEVRDASGTVVNRISAATLRTATGISLVLPEPNLKPGRYAVAIGTTLYPFEVR